MNKRPGWTLVNGLRWIEPCQHAHLGVLKRYNQTRCALCASKYTAQKWHLSEDYRERSRASSRKLWSRVYYRDMYGVTKEAVKELWERQDKRCAICPQKLDFPSRTTHLDHCHTTGIIRGLLCAPRNNGLGKFKDNPGNLRAAADYLENAKDAIPGRTKKPRRCG